MVRKTPPTTKSKKSMAAIAGRSSRKLGTVKKVAKVAKPARMPSSVGAAAVDTTLPKDRWVVRPAGRGLTPDEIGSMPCSVVARLGGMTPNELIEKALAKPSTIDIMLVELRESVVKAATDFFRSWRDR